MNDTNNKAVPAFKENLDCSPIYLGKDKTESSFWFYALKNGTARFLKYINYFYWEKGPQVILEMSNLPVEIEQELTLFLEGQVEYEFAKKRKNSREQTVRKHYRLPQEVGTTEEGLSESGKCVERVPDNVPGSTDVGRIGSGATVSVRQSEATPLLGTGRRRSRVSQHDGVPTETKRSEFEPIKATKSNKKPEMVENPPVKMYRLGESLMQIRGF